MFSCVETPAEVEKFPAWFMTCNPKTVNFLNALFFHEVNQNVEAEFQTEQTMTLNISEHDISTHEQTWGGEGRRCRTNCGQAQSF